MDAFELVLVVQAFLKMITCGQVRSYSLPEKIEREVKMSLTVDPDPTVVYKPSEEVLTFTRNKVWICNFRGLDVTLSHLPEITNALDMFCSV